MVEGKVRGPDGKESGSMIHGSLGPVVGGRTRSIGQRTGRVVKAGSKTDV
jgi:hypothetical protein